MMESKKSLVFFVIALALIVGYLFWKYYPTLSQKTTPPGPVEIKFWSLEDERLYKEVISAYNRSHPNVKVVFKEENAINYRVRVQTQLRASQGPDIFWLHSSWIPMFLPDLAVAPTAIISTSEFVASFYPVARDTLIVNGKILALPAELDGLVMFVSDDILKAQGLPVPTTWKEFVPTALQVTVKNQQGQIQTAGAALGTTGNVDFWPDILGMLFLQQPNTDLKNPTSKESAEILKFYTQFITDPQKKVWDTNLTSSTQMFADGKLTFYFGPSSQISVFKTANPNLNFHTYPVPQLGKAAAWGSFSALGVSNYSQNQKQAWEFLKYLTSSQIQKKLFEVQTQLGITPKPYARVDQASEIAQDPYLGSFVTQGPYYKGWYLNFKTLDSGINDEMISLYQKAVDGVLNGQDPGQALAVIAPQIQATLDKFTQNPETAK